MQILKEDYDPDSGTYVASYYWPEVGWYDITLEYGKISCQTQCNTQSHWCLYTFEKILEFVQMRIVACKWGIS